MKIIKQLSECIEKELDKAEDYIKLAVLYEGDFKEASKTFYSLSISRLDSVKILHDQIVNLINNYRAKNGEPPAQMMALYNYLHERQIEKMAAVKRLQELYKNEN